MATNNNLTDFLTSVAGAIRTKKGTSELIDPQDFSTEIENLPAGSGPDMSLANATENDVIYGKTFYASNNTLKTGANKIYIEDLPAVCYYTSGTISVSGTVTVRMPEDGSYAQGINYRLPKYFAHNNKNAVNFYFNSSLTTVPSYCFYGATSFYFPNFASTPIRTIDSYCFYLGNTSAFNFQDWPSTLKIIESRAFQECIPDGVSITLPTALERLGIWSFCSTLHKMNLGTLSIPSYSYSTLPNGCFYWADFNCDFVPPNCVTEIGSQFNCRGSFNNVTIPATCTKINDAAFGSVSTDAVSDFHIHSFIFLATNTPVMGNDIIAPQNMQRENTDFKIYVPDAAINNYKAHSKLAQYVNYIVGHSEHPGFTITYHLTNCTSSNTASTATLASNYTTTITPDSGYTLDGAAVSIKMGNVEHKYHFYSRSGNNAVITTTPSGSLYNYGTVGDLDITITAVAE